MFWGGCCKIYGTDPNNDYPFKEEKDTQMQDITQ